MDINQKICKIILLNLKLDSRTPWVKRPIDEHLTYLLGLTPEEYHKLEYSWLGRHQFLIFLGWKKV